MSPWKVFAACFTGLGMRDSRAASRGRITMRILIADDDRTLTYLLEHRLHKRGYEVLVTNDAGQTWEAVRRHSPDLVILDIKMAPGSGLAVLCKLKHLNFRSMPVIVVTAAENPSLLQQILALGSDALLRKPLQFADLVSEISRLLGPPRARQT